MNVLYDFRGQLGNLMAKRRDEPLKPVLDADNIANSIAVMRFHHNGSDHIIDAGA